MSDHSLIRNIVILSYDVEFTEHLKGFATENSSHKLSRNETGKTKKIAIHRPAHFCCIFVCVFFPSNSLER